MAGANNSQTMNEEELEELRAKLDLPEQVLEFLGRQPRLTVAADTVTVSSLVVIFPALAAALCVTPMTVWLLGDFGKSLVDAGLLPPDTLLFERGSTGIITAILLAGIGGMILSYYVYRLCTRLNPSLYFKSIAALLHPTIHFQGTSGPKYEGPFGAFAKWLLRGMNRNLPAREYLKRSERRYTAVWGCLALAFYLLAAGALAFDLGGIGRVTPQGVALSSFGGAANYRWQDVAGIGTECSAWEDKRLKTAVRYYLKFTDDRVVNLGAFRPLNTTWLDAMDTVDRKLAALGVPKTGVDLDERCLKAKRRVHGEEFDRFWRILAPRET
ncbi:MAG: hypothetical protein ACLFWF_03555 [Alphaproteobacteria bacterium]